MSDPTNRGGEGLAPGSAPASEMKSALAGFLNEFTGFQADIQSVLKKQEERLTMLDRKMIARPALSAAADAAQPHQKALAAYVRQGEEDGFRGLSLEGKAMSSTVLADGGYLVDPQTAETIRSVLRSTASIRQIASVVNVDSNSFDVIVDKTDLGSGWATETATAAETGTPAIERISIKLHELSAMPKVSQRLLDDTAFDMETWLAGRIANKFARSEAGAFINGTGNDQPKGFLHASYVGTANSAWTWGKLGYIPTGAAGDFNSAKPADAIVDLVYALDAEYRANATFVMNSKTAGAVRKMKDTDGRFLWSDGLAAAEPARLMGYPVLIAEDMPDIAANAYAIAFGDFAAGYTVAERPDLRILRDPFSAKPHVLFYASKRVGGDVSDFAAIKLLKFAVS